MNITKPAVMRFRQASGILEERTPGSSPVIFSASCYVLWQTSKSRKQMTTLSAGQSARLGFSSGCKQRDLYMSIPHQVAQAY
jgi:hypothetical protein